MHIQAITPISSHLGLEVTTKQQGGSVTAGDQIGSVSEAWFIRMGWIHVNGNLIFQNFKPKIQRLYGYRIGIWNKVQIIVV